MSEYTAIGDITNTILTLIKLNATGVLQQDHVNGLSPADVVEDENAQLSLFLYQVTENQHFKNQLMQETASGNIPYQPLSLNLYYLMTAYARTRETEQQVLGKAMQILHDNAVVRGTLLQGSLAESLEEIIVVMHPIPLEDMNKLWGMFGSKTYRISNTYRVSTATIDSARERIGNRVVEERFQYSIS